MNTTFVVAVIVISLFLGMLSCLGLFVLVKVFIGAVRLKQRIAGVPEQLAQRQNALNAAQAQIVKAQRALAEDKAAFEAKKAEPKP